MEGILAQALGALVLLGISAASYWFHATDAWGSVSGFVLGLVIGFTSGWAWVALLISFLVLGSAATRYRYKFKLSIHAAEDKRGARGFRNVIANGAVALVASVLNFFYPSPILPVVFVAAIASASADTLATEIGLLSKAKPVLITRPSSVTPPGISGGVTLLGELSAFVGSAAMALLAFALGIIPFTSVIILAAAAGFVGCTLDSLLGSTIQSLYSCQVCNAFTEKTLHCGKPTRRIKGVAVIGNNEVNLLSDVGAALVASLAFFL